VPDNRYPVMINGVAVVTAPAEIDAANAGQLRMILTEAASRGHAIIVVDMTRVRFCDSAGFSVLVAAHRWALGEGGGLRLVIPADSRVLRVFTVIGLGRFIPRFGSLEQALARGSDGRPVRRGALSRANGRGRVAWTGQASPAGGR
jgi:anti-sigma B factor antagonist